MDDHPPDLNRFVLAQEADYERAFREITAGAKRSHWMWYVFPQLAGLSHSAMARRYAIRDEEEARAYLAHPLLGPRLLACTEAVLTHAGRRSASEIFGSPDDLKLRSSATLFAHVSALGSGFGRLLDAFYPDGSDGQTLRLLGVHAAGETGRGEGGTHLGPGHGPR